MPKDAPPTGGASPDAGPLGPRRWISETPITGNPKPTAHPYGPLTSHFVSGSRLSVNQEGQDVLQR